MRNKLHINSSASFVLFRHADAYAFTYRPVAASVIFPSFISFLFQTEALWIFAACESAR